MKISNILNDYFGISQNLSLTVGYEEVIVKESFEKKDLNESIEDFVSGIAKDIIQNRYVPIKGDYPIDAFCHDITYEEKDEKVNLTYKCSLYKKDDPKRASLDYSIRGGKLYHPVTKVWHIVEWIKSIALIVWMPLLGFIFKVVIPAIYLAMKATRSIAISCHASNAFIQNLDRKILAFDDIFHSERALKNLTPLKALLGIALNPIFAALGVIPGLSHYFNRIIGDLERWENGHTFEDVANKSLGLREHEAIYIARCQQPYGALRGNFHKTLESSKTLPLPSVHVHKNVARFLFRQITSSDHDVTAVPNIHNSGAI